MNHNKQITIKEARSVSLGRHQAQCSICRHPQRQEIEEHWIDWEHISRIEDLYQISRDALRRHSHALDLDSERRANALGALERIIENVQVAPPSASAVVSAVKALVKLTSSGQGTEQAQGTNPKELFERMSEVERLAFAKDGSLPDWFSGAKAATPTDSQEGEKESQVTETKRFQ